MDSEKLDDFSSEAWTTRNATDDELRANLHWLLDNDPGDEAERQRCGHYSSLDRLRSCEIVVEIAFEELARRGYDVEAEA